MNTTKPIPKAKKPDKKRIAIFFDTNFLFTKDKRKIFSKFFFDFTTRYSSVIDFGLFIPDTVLMELKYQTLTEARNAFRALEKNAEFLNRVGTMSINQKNGDGSDAETKLTINIVESCIDKTFDQFLQKHQLQVIPLPHDKLDIREIQKLSIDRNGVFEPIRKSVDGKEIEVGEKGFRDHLIFKTIENLFSSVAGYEAYVILTQDKLLGTELTKIKAPHNLKLEILPSQEAVFSYFNIIQSSKNKEWVNQLLPLAKLHFFNDQEKTGIWFDQAKDKLNAKFEKQMSEKLPRSNPWDFRVDAWQMDSSKFIIFGTQFESANDSLFSWSNIVEYTKKFVRRPTTLGDLGRLGSVSGMDSSRSINFGSPPFSSSTLGDFIQPGLLSAIPEETETKMKFLFKWQAVISAQAEFSNFNIVEVILLDSED